MRGALINTAGADAHAVAAVGIILLVYRRDVGLRVEFSKNVSI